MKSPAAQVRELGKAVDFVKADGVTDADLAAANARHPHTKKILRVDDIRPDCLYDPEWKPSAADEADLGALEIGAGAQDEPPVVVKQARIPWALVAGIAFLLAVLAAFEIFTRSTRG